MEKDKLSSLLKSMMKKKKDASGQLSGKNPALKFANRMKTIVEKVREKKEPVSLKLQLLGAPFRLEGDDEPKKSVSF